MVRGTIIKGIGGFYYVKTKCGLYECRARGIFRKEKKRPTVGDYVEISILDEENKKGSLDKISKRKNELIRPSVANVDQAVIVFAAASPAMNLDLLDRFLVLVAEQGLDIIICINKIDLDTEKKYIDTARIYKKAGYCVYCVSAYKNIEIEELRQALFHKISVFAGPSGVGKSSLINAVVPEFYLKTGEVSPKIERGRHTTRHAELMEFAPESYIVDSPGFTSLTLNHIPPNELQYYFIEFEPYKDKCKYTGCSHTHEPSCYVKEEVGNAISQMRYDRYVYLYEQLTNERRK